MNIIPPAGYSRPVLPSRQGPTRLNNADNRKREHTHGERRSRSERRQNLIHIAQSCLEMRQIGDRRHSNRLFVTT